MFEDIPEYDENRPLTNREQAIIKEKKKDLAKQKEYTNILKMSWKNLSFLLCYLLISVTGFFYPFNIFEQLMQSELGIIPSNISFILSCGTGCFFMFAGYYGIFYDRYGCSWGLYIGAILSFLGNLCLSASFQHIITPDMLQLSLQCSIVSGGYGMIYITCLLIIIKSAANRHRGKVNGFAQSLWMMGAYTTPKLNGAIFKGVVDQNYIAEQDATNEGKMVLFRGIWTALLFIIGSFLINQHESKWYMHRDWKYKPYFKPKYNKHFTMKQFGDIQFWCFLVMGSFMLCACYLYPSQISLILDSFNERSNVSMYKQTISFLAAGSALITGIGIDLLKWYQRPAMFMFISVLLIFIANTMIIFNMYDMLLISASINAIALGIFWGCYPIMMSDIYGLANLGTNLGVCFVIGGLICGLLQTAGGEWYAQTIEDNDIRCYGDVCFRKMFIINDSLICLSFVFLITLSKRVREKKDIRRKGVLDVKYLDEAAEKDFIESRLMNKDLFSEKPDEDVWFDNEIIYDDKDGKKIFSGLLKDDDDETLSQIEMNEINDDGDSDDFKSTAQWSQGADDIVFSDDMIAKMFHDSKKIKSRSDNISDDNDISENKSATEKDALLAADKVGVSDKDNEEESVSNKDVTQSTSAEIEEINAFLAENGGDDTDEDEENKKMIANDEDIVDDIDLNDYIDE